jgi:hypothetical protein
MLIQGKFENGAHAQTIETALLQELSGQYQRHEANYAGSTECFVGADVEAIKTKVSEMRPSYHNARKEYYVF